MRADALASVREALHFTRDRIERARGDGAVPAWDRYYEHLAGTVEEMLAMVGSGS